MQIIAIIAVALCLAVIVALVSDVEEYKTFAAAQQMPDGKTSTIVGELTHPDQVIYNPQQNPNLTVFYMTDKEGGQMKVKYFEPKPRDFEKSDQVTITGKVVGDEFHASRLLMKCPSKYVEDGEFDTAVETIS